MANCQFASYSLHRTLARGSGGVGSLRIRGVLQDVGEGCIQVCHVFRLRFFIQGDLLEGQAAQKACHKQCMVGASGLPGGTG
jgi:hypothetical protein